MEEVSFSVVVPTLNPGRMWGDWVATLLSQEGVFLSEVLVIDSSSDDSTVDVARQCGFITKVIPRLSFSHGGTRQMGVEMTKGDIVVFLTQDALLADKTALRNLLAVFRDLSIGAAYGRQLPHHFSSPIGAHARIFNYPEAGQIKTLEDRVTLGLKTAFISNSFAAYRRDELKKVGGFPRDTIFAEDMAVAARLLMVGKRIAYCPDARVFHSHDYTVGQEFRRYFDIGVFHAREGWLRDTFGAAEGDGLRFVVSELRYIALRAPHLIPSAAIRTFLKLAGYRLGTLERYLPWRMKKIFSMHKSYWDRKIFPPKADQL